jgi:hypothetical protein
MKKTGSEPAPAEPFERIRLQADVAKQRVRIAKEELRRARKRLKEAKREARRARKHAAAARKAFKRARRDRKGRVPPRPTKVAAKKGRKAPARAASVAKKATKVAVMKARKPPARAKASVVKKATKVAPARLPVKRVRDRGTRAAARNRTQKRAKTVRARRRSRTVVRVPAVNPQAPAPTMVATGSPLGAGASDAALHPGQQTSEDES